MVIYQAENLSLHTQKVLMEVDQAMERQVNEGEIPLLDSPIPQAAMDATASLAPGITETSLRGVWLVVVRATWLLVVLGSLVFFGASLPTYFVQVQTVCTVVGASNSSSTGASTAGSMMLLAHWRLSAPHCVTRSI